MRTKFSFRQSYASPGINGRFLAFANAHIKEARECRQHGAHLIWTAGSHDVLVYETQIVESSGNGTIAYPGLVLCVKGGTPAVREVLDSISEEARKMLKDKVHGYPGLRSVVYEGIDLVPVSALTSFLRTYLESRFEHLFGSPGRQGGGGDERGIAGILPRSRGGKPVPSPSHPQTGNISPIEDGRQEMSITGSASGGTRDT